MNYDRLTDQQFSQLLWEHCSAEVKAEVRRNRGKNPDEALVERLTQEFLAAIPDELHEAMRRRALCGEVERCLTEVAPITEILGNVPSALTRLRLPSLCCYTAPEDKRHRKYIRWPEATWSMIQTQLGILRSSRASEPLISAIDRLAAHVEPTMRDNPAMTLGEAMGLLA